MANPTISQIKVGNTTYDIYDANTRNNIETLQNDIDTVQDNIHIMQDNIDNLTVSVNNLTLKIVLLQNHVDNSDSSWSAVNNLSREIVVNCDVVKCSDGSFHYTHFKKTGLAGYTQLGCFGVDAPNSAILCSFQNNWKEDSGYNSSNHYSKYYYYTVVKARRVGSITGFTEYTFKARNVWMKREVNDITVGG